MIQLMRSDQKRNLRVVFVNGYPMPFMSGDIRPFEILHRKTAYAMYSTLSKWWLRTRFFLLFLVTFQLSNAQQVLQTNRYELPLEKNGYYEVMPSQEDGIFLFRRLLFSD